MQKKICLKEQKRQKDKGGRKLANEKSERDDAGSPAYTLPQLSAPKG